MADTQIIYRITDCCSLDGNFVDVEIDLLGNPYPGDGIYSRPLILGDLVINSSFTLEAGKTYLIIQGALSSAPLPLISIADVNLEQGGVLSCRDANANTIPCAFLYYISPCCEEYGNQGLAAAQANLDNLGFDVDINGTFIYNGPTQGPTPLFPTQLINGACYTITRNQTDTLLTEVIDFALFSAVEGCEDLSCGDCPTLPGIHYLKFEPCCGGDPIYTRAETFGGVISTDPDGQVEGSSQRSSYAVSGGTSANPSTPDFSVSDYLGVHQYLATATATSAIAGLVPGQCYTITLGSVGDGEISITEYLDLPYAPYQNQISEEIIDCETAPCPECNPTIYALTNCEGITINTETDLSAVLDTHVELEGIDGCWYVQEYDPFIITDGVDGTIDSSVSSRRVATSNRLPSISTQPVTVVGPCAEDCPCLCYEVIDYDGAYTYIDCEGNTIYLMSSGADKFCAQARPHLIGKEGQDYTLIEGDACVDGECVDKCFLLTNCDPTAYPDQDATITSTLQSLSQYVATNEAVALSGYSGCWTVEETEVCDCPVDVTVTIEYTDCQECLGITAYKLFNCEKINEVIYTTQDLSAYVGQVIKDDCACWVVEEIDYQPPSETTIVDPVVFEDCTTCLAIYYTLTDCDNSESVIVTLTNLSAYVGQVVKIEGCDPCYEVALYEDNVAPDPWEEVTVTEASATCFDCKQLVPRCSTVFNNSTEDRTFTFINANGDSEETEIVKSGHFSLRHCVQYWDEPDSFIYNYHGDCTVFEYDGTPAPNDCNCIDILINNQITYTALFLGQIYDGAKVYEFTIDGIPYFLWSCGTLFGCWDITPEVGNGANRVGQIKSGIVECPVAPEGAWTPGVLPGGVIVNSINTTEGDCPTVTIKEGHCKQYFPNKRKVKPGYNTPICSADKYDKITCNFADIAYKKVLELRYGISNCCPEEDEKWLIKKELIELQALTDPDYTCDQIADCCGNSTSHCSCNS